MDQSQFEDLYWNSKSNDVRTLRTMDQGNDRIARAVQLAVKGNVIDQPIMAWGWSAFLEMTERLQFGYTWVPSLLMAPVQLAPGLVFAGFTPYDPGHPPAGSIKVSLDPADYPPFDPPAPVVPVGPAPTSLVGIPVGAGYFQAFPHADAVLKDGEEYAADPRGVFIFHRSSSPFAKDQKLLWFTEKV